VKLANLQHRVLLVFLDGVGIGTMDTARNPFFKAKLPFLLGLLDGKLPSIRQRTIVSSSAILVPADANLSVSGLPQSGTGQSTLYTGINTLKIIGKHFGPYLYSSLKPVIAAKNIFKQLKNGQTTDNGLAFANAFPQRFFDYLNGSRPRMVAGMFAALSSEIPFRTIKNLKEGSAVSADITAERWKEIGHPDAPVIEPYDAGKNLAGIASNNRFTLFEYFLTDKAGHDRDMECAVNILEELDVFFQGIFDHVDRSSMLVIVTSDHGNLEDLNTKSHTRNPVPVVLFGNQRENVALHIHNIADISPAICRFLTV